MIDPYAPPSSDVDDEPAIVYRSRSAQFFHVSTSTLATLYLVTFGMYGVYWFYKHWSVRKRAYRLRISPVARAVFSIFFVHRLFKLIDETARATGVSTRWSPSTQATSYVMLVLGLRIFGSFAFGVESLVFQIAALVAIVIPLVAAQRVANLANGRTLLDEDDAEEVEE
ncbi:MAG TPA: hypothetical protein VER96_32280 [Polyangiaceae bacterium]|nr:hypothetical protein [Polyangiaceae bacterium]